LDAYSRPKADVHDGSGDRLFIKGSRPVTAVLALLFGRAFDQTPQYWLNLQADYDLKTAEASMGERLSAVHAVAHA